MFLSFNCIDFEEISTIKEGVVCIWVLGSMLPHTMEISGRTIVCIVNYPIGAIQNFTLLKAIK